MDPDCSISEMKARQNRQTWKNSVDYVFNLLGWVVGLGNVWRFPYLCFENGGGAFLVAYLLLLLIIYFPLFTLEASLGQLVGRSTVKSWGIIPLMGGIGYFGGTVLLYGGIYMPVVLSWVLRWIVASFSYDLPWITCGNSWNTESCVNIFGPRNLSKNTTISEVVESGPGLVFTVYPAALAFLPLPQLWCVIFFLMLLFLGIDSQFVALETLLACLEDVQPKAFKYGRKLTVGITLLVFYSISTCMVMGNGVYTLGILDRYARTGWCLLFVTVCEFVTLGWLYGSERLSDDISKMLGYELPRIWIKITSRFIGPAVSVVVLILSLTHYKPLVAGDAYPAWADVIGWLLTLSSILWIPGYAIYAVSTADGDSVLQKFMKSVSVKDLGRYREDSKDFELQRFESNQ